MSARRTPSDDPLIDGVRRRITFVVVTRNSARTIERCLASLLAQGAQHEIIVVDNDSTDETRALVDRIGVSIVSGGPGRASQRNRGWAHATGEFVCFIDGDQRLDPGAAEEILRTFNAFPSVAALVLPEGSFGQGFVAKGLELEKLMLEPDPRAESARVFRSSTLGRLGELDEALPPPFDEFEFTDRLRINGLVVSKITRAVRRDDGRATIGTIYRQAVRYGTGWRAYRTVRPTDRSMVRTCRLDRGNLRAALWGLPALAFVKLVARVGVATGRLLTPRWAIPSAVSTDVEPTVEMSWIRRHAPLLAYAAPMTIAALTTFTWFSPGRSIAGGEFGPFLPRSAISTATRAWGYTTTGAGSPTSEAARIFDGIVLGSVSFFGGGPSVAQHLLYAVLLALAVAGLVFFFRQILPGSSWAPSVVALLAIANPGVVSLLPDPRVPAALAASGFLAGVIIRAMRSPTSFRRLAVATVPIAYVAHDRGLLALVGLAGLLAIGCTITLSGRSGSFRAIRSIVPQVPLVVAIHAWWLLPELSGWSSRVADTYSAVSGSPAASSWAGITTMTAHRSLEALPWAVHFDEWPLVAARWFFPIVALLAPLLATERRLRRIAAGLLLVALAAVFTARSRGDVAVPSLLLVICYSTNASITFHAMFVRASRWRSSRHALRFAAVYLVLGIGVTGFPLFTGAIAQQAGGVSVATARVQVPTAWSKLGRDIDAARTFGKTLVLPTVPREATTTWGYRGVADLPRDVSSRPVILGSIDERSDVGFGAMIGFVESQLGRGRSEGLLRSLDSLGVSHVVVRHDLTSAAGTEPVETGAMMRALESSGLFADSSRYGVATLFTRIQAPSPVQMYTRVHTFDARGSEQGAASIARLRPDTAGIGVMGSPPTWASRATAQPSERAAIGVRSVGPHGYRAYVHIPGARDVIVALVDTAHSGWRLSGVPAGATVTPVTVDGFRQGWWVRADRSFEASIAFRPAELTVWAQRLSVTALLVLFLSVVNRVRTRRLAKRPGNYLPALREHRLEMAFVEDGGRDDRTDIPRDRLELPAWLDHVPAGPRTFTVAAPESRPPGPPSEQAMNPPAPHESGDLSELDAALALQRR